jgi:hypothetical protein
MTQTTQARFWIHKIDFKAFQILVGLYVLNRENGATGFLGRLKSIFE